MNEHTKILLVLGIIAGLVLTASATFLMLKAVSPSNPKTNSQSHNEPETNPNAQKARSLENEANKLMASDPTAAKAKYLQAEKAYAESSNDLKASEMRNNATTAEVSIPLPPPQDEPQILKSGG